MQFSLRYLHPIEIDLQIPLQDFTAYCSLSDLDIFWDEQLAEALNEGLRQAHFQILAQSVDLQNTFFIAHFSILPAQLEVDLSIIPQILQQHAPLLHNEMHYRCPVLSKT